MDFKIIDPVGSDIIIRHEADLSLYLDKPDTYWNQGSGDSALWLNDTEGLLFFKYHQMFFVMEISSYLSPVQNLDMVTWLKHAIGGEPFFFSSRHLSSKEQLQTILWHYFNFETLHPDFEWKDPIPSEAELNDLHKKG